MRNKYFRLKKYSLTRSKSAEEFSALFSKTGFTSERKLSCNEEIFELKFLVMFTNKSQNLCPRIQLFMKNDYPLCVKFTVATLGKLLFCVSPYDEDRIAKDFDEDDEYDEDDN